MPITLYTTSTCPYSQQERQYLDGLGLVYTTVVLDQEQVRMPEFLTASGGFCAVPVTVITHDEGSKTVTKGFNKEELDKVLTAPSQTNVANDQPQAPAGETPTAPSTPIETPPSPYPTQAPEPPIPPAPETPPVPDGETPSPPLTASFPA